MKTLIAFAVLAIIIALSSCRSGYVNLGNNGQEFEMRSAGGDVAPERYIDIKTKEAHGYGSQTLYNEHVIAVQDGNLAKADSLQDLIDRLQWSGMGMGSNNYGIPSPGRSTRVYVENRSSNKMITVTSVPFVGLTLMPGERSKYAYLVPVGKLSLTYTASDGRSNSKKYAEVPVYKGQEEPIFFY